MSYINKNHGEYVKAQAPAVPQPWDPKPQEIPVPEKELPDMSDLEAGTYTLQCVVTSAGITLKWVEVTEEEVTAE